MRPSLFLPAALLSAGGLYCAGPATAQQSRALPIPSAQAPASLQMVQEVPGTTDADRLAAAVRRLGANPRDLPALVEAGELSVKLGDPTAAAALFKRAEQIDPANGRVKAGIARILVNGEHPGEALRYFQQAERYGARVADFADDRGLAYDLVGDQERAQRDYRLSLSREDNDEVRRRYALSLGISGRKDEALAQIDPLVRKSDRGAWRARAFVLAMNGDAAGANRIARNMMPAGMGAGLSAFFQRLPALTPADRAYAVHFGEVTGSPTRLADARLAPPLPALQPEPARPATQVAAVETRPTRERRRRGRDRGVTPPPVVATVSTQPVVVGERRADAGVRPMPPTVAPAATAPATVLAAVDPRVAPVPRTVASAVPARDAAMTSRASTVPAATMSARPSPAPAAAVPARSGDTPEVARVGDPGGSAAPGSDAPFTAAAPARTVTAAGMPAPTPTTGASVGAVSPSSATQTAIAAAAPALAPAAVTPVPGVVPAVAATSPATVQPANAAPAAAAGSATQLAATPTPPRMSEDSILARIVAGIGIPASELGVRPMPGEPPAGQAVVTTPTTTLDQAALTAQRNAATQELARAAVARSAAAAAGARPEANRRKPATPRAEAVLPIKPADRKKTADAKTKALADAEDAGKPAGRKSDAKAAAADARATGRRGATKAAPTDEVRGDPARIWVQVAGGANDGDLARAWSGVRKKAGATLKGKQGYATPLRATNRVLTGPFKTEAEARAVVNALGRQGVQAFTFSSTKGQKVTKLEDK